MNLDSDIEEEKLKRGKQDEQTEIKSKGNRSSYIQPEEDLGSPDFLEHLKELMTNWLFLFVTLSLCSVYFVVTGIQFWTTAYMVYVLKVD